MRGRGGAGFPAGTKWRFAREAAGEEKFIVANGDEGDPGSYIDKYLMERSPDAGARGDGAGRLRGRRRATASCSAAPSTRCPSRRWRRRSSAARADGLLGEDILGSGFAFDVTVVEGAGSYVVGEETALLACLQGLRGTVSARPPFPAERGLHGHADGGQQHRDARPTSPSSPRAAPTPTARSAPARDRRQQARLLQRALRARRASTRSRSGSRCASSARRSPAACATAPRSRRCRSAARSAASCPPRGSTRAFDFDALAAEGCMVGHGGDPRLRRAHRHARRRPPPAALRRRTRAAASASRAGSGCAARTKMFATEAPVDRGAAARSCWRRSSSAASARTAAACRRRSAACWPTSPTSWGSHEPRVDGRRRRGRGRRRGDDPRRRPRRRPLGADALLRRAPGPVRRLPRLPGRRRGRAGAAARLHDARAATAWRSRPRTPTARRVAGAVVELVLSELPEPPAPHTELAQVAARLGCRRAALAGRVARSATTTCATPTSPSGTSSASRAGAACAPATRSRAPSR